MVASVEVYYSLQSDYCYFLLDRLLNLAAQDVDVSIRPILGAVLRLPERYRDRDAIEGHYFETDTARTARFLGLPYSYPDPSPIEFNPDTLWIAEPEQPRNEYLNRLYVGAVQNGKGLAFLDRVGRMLWDGSTPNWDKGDHVDHAMAAANMDLDKVLTETSWSSAQTELAANAQAILDAGHWGVPLMVYNDEPFYGQDRFDQLVWLMKQNGDLA